MVENPKDAQILYELDKNSRITISKLTKKLNLSRDVISYRIKQLEKKKIIRNYSTLIDFSKLGLTTYRIHFKLFAMNTKNFEKLIFELTKNKAKVTETEGFSDLIMELNVKNDKEISKLNKKIKTMFSKYIKESKISKVSTHSHLNKAYLIKTRAPREEIKVANNKKIKFDNTDLRIINFLLKNSRTPLIKIAKELQMDSSAIIYRIKQLEKKEIIKAYNLKLDNNREKYTIKFILSDPTLENINKLKVYCLKNPNTTNFIESIERFDLELTLETTNAEEYYTSIREIKDKFDFIAEILSSRTIRNFETPNQQQIPIKTKPE